MRWKAATSIFVAALLLALFVPAGFAQTLAKTQDVTLSATAAESFDLTLSGNTVTWNNITPGSGTNAPTSGDGITVTTSWKLKGGRSAVKLYAYFDAAAAALAHQEVGCGTMCVDIPASAVELKGGDVASFIPVTGSAVGSGPANSTLLLQTTSLTKDNRNGEATATLNFNLNLSSTEMQQLPAGDYTGTLPSSLILRCNPSGDKHEQLV